MRFDRFCRKPVVSAPRHAAGTALRALGLSLALLPLAGSSIPYASAAAHARSAGPRGTPCPHASGVANAKSLAACLPRPP